MRRNALWRAQPVEDGLVGRGAPGDDELVVNRVNRERVGKAGNGRPGGRRGEAESGIERKGQGFDIPAQFHVVAGPGNEQLWPGGKIAGLHLESAYVAGIAGRSGQIQNILWPRQVTLIACESAVAGVNGRAAGQQSHSGRGPAVILQPGEQWIEGVRDGAEQVTGLPAVEVVRTANQVVSTALDGINGSVQNVRSGAESADGVARDNGVLQGQAAAVVPLDAASREGAVAGNRATVERHIGGTFES